MKYNMKQWVTDYLNAPAKKAIPILSFPGVQLIGHTVEELVKDGHLQALCMKAVADRYDAGAAVYCQKLSRKTYSTASYLTLLHQRAQ